MCVQKKMEAEGISPSAIAAFESTFKMLSSGETGIIPESSISPVPDLDKASELNIKPDTSLLAKTVVLKLNGGLGTGMGLDKAKSLLKVNGDDTFLDFIAKQVISMRKQHGFPVKFMLMNSFSTSEDTLNFLKEKYPELAKEDGLEMLQNKVPKLDAETLEVRLITVEAAGSFLREVCIFLTKLGSLQLALLTQRMNGVLLAMGISTLHS